MEKTSSSNNTDNNSHNAFLTILTQALDMPLCIADLCEPNEKAETLLSRLTSEQLNIIEQTLNKIREKKNEHMDSNNPAASLVARDPSSSPSSTCSSLASSSPSTTTITASIEATPNTSMAPAASSASCWTAATEVAQALASAMSKPGQKRQTITGAKDAHEPVTEMRDGVEWVSFVYSHHRVLRRYCIRTDLDKVDLDQLTETFKRDNCVYPRANLPREQYKGNRWAYETECNLLGWKLAFLNADEIGGKRGLIQRAVDSYRNRSPSMRSRRVARQEKLLNGTLRKRKQRDDEDADTPAAPKLQKSNGASRLPSPSPSPSSLPKTISIDDGYHGKCRIRINVDSVPLESIDADFRRGNCVFPRAMDVPATATPRQLDEARCNELGWKLAWLNPRQLANRKSLLQRVLDIYRVKFAPELRPRKYTSRTPTLPPPVLLAAAATMSTTPPPQKLKLTADNLAAQQEQLGVKSEEKQTIDAVSLYSGTTVTLDFHDCFSPPADNLLDDPFFLPSANMDTSFLPDTLFLPSTNATMVATGATNAAAPPPICADMLQDDMLSCIESSSSASSNTPSNQSSPRHQPLLPLDPLNPDSLFLLNSQHADMHMTLFGQTQDDVLLHHMSSLATPMADLKLDYPGSLTKMEDGGLSEPFMPSTPSVKLEDEDGISNLTDTFLAPLF
ncbi:hypothetical protein BCR43DRAFT_270795 [Syncephalastrum racemosum]|uniref:DUF8032 domain-containing protein n=1 Tax=Syncephalastrum racemosum TaxID=13706 RepID=A0A1X2HBW6_SYNRA|nr:hypothetical protein BCR43DRAFT_270795 [Syncephalastrum racemosum]